MDTSSVSDVDLHVVGKRMAFSALDPIPQAHEKDRPFGAAMVHELNWLLPPSMSEENEDLAVFCLQSESYFGPDPFVRASSATPLDQGIRLGRNYLHVEATAVGHETDHATRASVACGATDPPVGQSVQVDSAL
jgi:hypothetical protein